jgi:hypothetical protein
MHPLFVNLLFLSPEICITISKHITIYRSSTSGLPFVIRPIL